MVLRFHDTGNLQRAVMDSWLVNPDHALTLKQHIYLLENGDLYIDDSFDSDLTGMFLLRLRTHNYFEENAEVIVPRR
jgi:hypothetical protein